MTQTATFPFAGLQGMPNFMPDWQGFMQRMAAMPRVMDIASKVRKGATHSEVVYEEDKLRLLRYTWGPPKKYATPLVVSFALVNRPYILDLLAHKSVVRHFLQGGFDVYLIDWGTPSHGDRNLGISDYVEGYLHNVMEFVKRRSEQGKINLLGYCMGGTLSAMYSALHPDSIRNLILMAAPIDFSQRDSLLSVWCDEKYFDVDALVDVYGNAPPQWLQVNFMLLKPVANLVEKYLNFYEKMTDEKFLEEFFAMEQWVNDNIPVAGRTFAEFVRYGIQQNLLVRGQWPVGRRRVDLRKIDCPVLNLMASADHLVPCGQSLIFNELVGSSDRETVQFPAGHIGLAVGGKAQTDLWPKACEWLSERSAPLSSHPSRPARKSRPTRRSRR